MNSLSKLMGEGRKLHYIIGAVYSLRLVHSFLPNLINRKKSFCWFWVLVWSVQYFKAFWRFTWLKLLELRQATFQISQTPTVTWSLPYVSRTDHGYKLTLIFRGYWPLFYDFRRHDVHFDVQPAPPLCSKTRNHWKQLRDMLPHLLVFTMCICSNGIYSPCINRSSSYQSQFNKAEILTQCRLLCRHDTVTVKC